MCGNRSGRAARSVRRSRRCQRRCKRLKNVLRIRETLAKFPPAIGKGAEHVAAAGHRGRKKRLSVLRKSSLSLAISDRLGSDPRLQAADSQKLRAFAKYSSLDGQAQNSDASGGFASLGHKTERTIARDDRQPVERRRGGFASSIHITRRSGHAIAAGDRGWHGNTEGGDPLFDLRPVWMASPETVAQIFPRDALFDVVIFDEASQCRLEEALAGAVEIEASCHRG